MIAAILGGFLIAALIGLYLSIPPVQRREISAARFFKDLARPKVTPRRRFGLKSLLTSPLFYLQFLMLAALLWAILSVAGTADAGPHNIGVRLLIDTSASMTTLQDGASRMELAQDRAITALRESAAAAEGAEWCVQIATFDSVLLEQLNTGNLALAAKNIEAITPRALDTNLEAIRHDAARLDREPNPTCAITHIVVVTDQPAPAWLPESPRPIKWQDIGQAIASVGFSSITAVRDRLSGQVLAVQVEVAAYGTPPATTALTLTGPADPIEQTIGWENGSLWQWQFTPTIPGIYTLALPNDGVYEFDDRVTIDIPADRPIQVDWQISDRSTFDLLRWVAATDQPQIRVIPLDAWQADSTQATLIVGPGFSPAPGSTQQIRYFDEASWLLDDLNLDVAEHMGVPIAPALEGFSPVLQGAAGEIWVAARAEPRAVYIAGLPIWDDDNAGAFSQTLFFNALRVLLDQDDPQQVYSLTSAEAPEPQGTRLALHPGEGNTHGEPQSAGDLADWRSDTPARVRNERWPPLLALACGILMLERMLATGGKRWS
jgi:hypothetical protein